MIFDTHAHLDDNTYNDNLGEVIESIRKAGITNLVNPGCDIPTSKRALDIANNNDFIYAAVGFHPNNIEELTSDDLQAISELYQEEKVVAIGEIGLDYHYEDYDEKKQKEVFIDQLQLAKSHSLPVIIHSRDASGDTLEILKNHKDSSIGCVLHCFSQSKEMAREYLNLGCKISFAGPITFKNARGLLDVVKYVPLESMFIETDSPYLTPHPYRGKVNSPAHVKLVGRKAAELKGLDKDILFEVTANNAKEFFGIK